MVEFSKKIKCPYESQILKDIPRTKSDVLEKNQTLFDKMKNILVCYSIRNNSIGYCQGFNFIILRILEIVNDEVRKNIYLL